MSYFAVLIRMLGFALALAMMFLVGIVEIIGLCIVAGSLPSSWVSSVGLLVGLPVSLLMAYAIHEVGHVQAGILTGFKPLFAHVGPLMLKPKHGSWCLSWDRSQSLLLARALFENRPASRGQLLTLALGGCVGNLIACIPLVLMAMLMPPACRGLIELVILNSTLTGFVNLAPVRLFGYDSDGLCVLRLLWQREVRPFNVGPLSSVL